MSSLNVAAQPIQAGLPFPKSIGIINDYVRIPYANGSSFASQFLYREFTRRGHDIRVLGPRDPSAVAADLPEGAIEFDSLPLRNHPGFYLAMPSQQALQQCLNAKLDVVLAQTGSGLLELGTWLRGKARVPLLCVNTIHLPSVYNVLLPDALHGQRNVTGFFEEELIPRLEALTASSYNMSDGLIVLSRGLERYWRERGVRVPIHVIPRSVDPVIFGRTHPEDPFPHTAPRGGRLLCVCRHTREKNVSRLLEIFAMKIAPSAPNATLTLIGDGPDHDSFVAQATRLGVGERVFFPGEFPVTEVARYYGHADVFVYTSLSETYGQVVSEALYCGLPVVAFDDDMGVAHQLREAPHALVAPGPDLDASNELFARAVIELLNAPARRRTLGERAARIARERTNPELAIALYYDAFLSAHEHCRKHWEPRPASSRGLDLARWAAFHALVAGLGHVRQPARINRHGRRQPNWNELLRGSAATTSEASLDSAFVRPLTAAGA